MQVTAAVTPAVTVYGGYGTDNPDDEDFLTVVGREAGIENAAISFGVQPRASAQIAWGVEYRRLETKYLIAGDKDVSQVNVGFTFTFQRLMARAGDRPVSGCVAADAGLRRRPSRSATTVPRR